jgi:hypothetical protein
MVFQDSVGRGVNYFVVPIMLLAYVGFHFRESVTLGPRRRCLKGCVKLLLDEE